MTLSRFVEPLDRHAIAVHLGILSRLAAFVMGVPALVALALGQAAEALAFVGVAALALAAGSLPRLRTTAASQIPELKLADALVVTALAYLAFASLGALPYLRHASPVDAFFDSLSGFTTTGLGVIDIERLPRSLLFFRAWSQWIGGAGISVLSVAVLLAPGTDAVRLHESEASSGGLVGSVVSTARVVLTAYLSLTVVSIALLAVAGTPLWEALLNGLAAISTGGFAARPESLGPDDGAARLLALTAVMLVGATSVRLWPEARKAGLGHLARDPQLRLLLVLSLGAALFFAGSTGFARPEWVPSITDAVSTLTTTGFSVTEPATWGEGRKLVATGLMIVGGSAGSTAGGLKLLRILLFLRLSAWVLRRALLPREATVPLTLGGRPLTELEVRQSGAIVGLHLLVVFLGALALGLTGAPAIDALFESASATGTVGLSTGVTSAALPAWAKLLLCLQMWGGRLEILPVLVLCHPRTWRRRRRSK